MAEAMDWLCRIEGRLHDSKRQITGDSDEDFENVASYGWSIQIVIACKNIVSAEDRLDALRFDKYGRRK